MSACFFFNDAAPTELYTLSLHDALPICPCRPSPWPRRSGCRSSCRCWRRDRKSTRLNSSHVEISYAVFCLKKKNQRDKVTASAQTARLPRERIRRGPATALHAPSDSVSE